MLPYTYTLASGAMRTGKPITRPLVFDFAEDVRALDERHSFMFGRSLHVSPVTEPGITEWPVYLPSNDDGWCDIWTGEWRAGGMVHQVAAPIDRIPIHARAGTILPLGPVVQSTAEMTGRKLDIYVFPGADGQFTCTKTKASTTATRTARSH